MIVRMAVAVARPDQSLAPRPGLARKWLFWPPFEAHVKGGQLGLFAFGQ
jgi:hypothetical protein